MRSSSVCTYLKKQCVFFARYILLSFAEGIPKLTVSACTVPAVLHRPKCHILPQSYCFVLQNFVPNI